MFSHIKTHHGIILLLASFLLALTIINQSNQKLSELSSIATQAIQSIPARSQMAAALEGANSGLVGWWKFDEGSGTTASDSSGNGNSGTLVNGPVWVAGNVGNGAISFDGVDDYVNISSSASLLNLGPLSYSFWAYPKSAGEGSNGKVLSKGSGTIEFEIQGGTWRFFRNYSGASLIKRSSSNVVFNKWSHVVVTWDGGSLASGVHVYINGVLNDGGIQNASGSPTSDAGAQGISKSTNSFDGTIDDVRVYNRVLSATEVTDLYNYTAGSVTNSPPFTDIVSPLNTSTQSNSLSITTTATTQTPTTYTLAVSKSGTGTITGGSISCGSICTQTSNSGTAITLTSTPATGSTFSGWSGGGCSGTGSCVINLSADTTVTATFTTVSTPTGNARYIRAGATGIGDGTDWTNAWLDVANIDWTKITPGTTIYIAGGQYTNLVMKSSGNASDRIYIKRATVSDPIVTSTNGWNPSFDSQVVMNYIGNAVGASYFTIDGVIPYTGIQIKNPLPFNTTNDTYTINFGVKPFGFVEFKNIDAYGSLDANYASIPGGERRSLNFSSFATSIYIGYSQFHGSDTLVSTSGGMDDVIIEHNKFFDNYHTNNNHPNVWQTLGAKNVIFRYNEFYNWQAEGIMMDFVSASDQPNVNWYIYGNIFHDGMSPTSAYYPRVLTTQYRSNGPIYLFNNTFVNVWVPILKEGGTFDPGSQGRNNIFWNLISRGTIFTDEANDIIGNGITNNPFLDYANKDYRLKAGSSAVDTGATLSSINEVTFTSDFSSTPRPQGSAWDIGAYEFVGGGTTPPADTTPPAAPTGLMVN